MAVTNSKSDTSTVEPVVTPDLPAVDPTAFVLPGTGVAIPKDIIGDGFVVSFDPQYVKSQAQLDLFTSLREQHGMTSDKTLVDFLKTAPGRNNRKLLYMFAVIDILRNVGSEDRPMTERMMEAGGFHLGELVRIGVKQSTIDRMRDRLIGCETQQDYGVWRAALKLFNYNPDANRAPGENADGDVVDLQPVETAL